jgi:hypothetical protein
MTDNQENKLRMYYTVSAVCDYHIELWQDNEVFVFDYHRFKQKIPKIEKCREQVRIESILAETFKSFDRVELEEMAYYLSGKLKFFAKYTGNQSLFAQVCNSRDNICMANHYELISICNLLADHGSTYLNQLSPYDITPESVAALQQLTSLFFVNLKRAKSSHQKNKSTEEQLRKLFRDIDNTLRSRLDNNIEFYKNSNPEFYTQYKAARVIFGTEPPYIKETKELVSEYSAN